MSFSSIRLLGLALCLILISCQGVKEKSPNIAYYNIGGEPSTLNPMAAVDAYSAALHGYMFESLLSRHADTYEFEPGLASSWEISKDNKRYTFKLKEGLKWSDGTPLTVEDVKFSYDVIYTDAFKAVQLRSYFDSIKEVNIIDSKTVEFIVKDDYFRNFDICAGLSILPKHFYGDSENKKFFNKKIIASGPYVLDKYDRGQKITLEKNSLWWGNTDTTQKDVNQIKKIILRFSAEENVSLELLKRGDLDFLGLRPDGFVKKTVGEVWDKKIIKVKTQNKTPKGYNYIAFNLTHPMFKDREVRKALSMLFNRKLIQEKFEYNLTDAATGPIYTQSDYADKTAKPVEFNPEKALKILQANGWSDSNQDGVLDKKINGKKVSLRFTIMDPSPEMVKYLTIFKEDAQKVGVDVLIKPIEWNSFIKLLDERNFDAVRLAWGGGSVDIDLKQVWHSSSIPNGGSNFISYSNPEVDKLIEESRRILDKNKRMVLLQKAHRLIAEDYPYIFFTNSVYTLYAHTKRVVKPKDTFNYSIGQEYWVMK